ncbi:MAG TPA: tetratricopeptide repeat protein [Bryobacteraceae bacterium]|nr:tetratricopeptide repeat protein [Bryobacteraceae bacterium]
MLLMAWCLTVLGNPVALNNRAAQLYFDGRFEEAEYLYHVALAGTSSTDLLRTAAISSNLGALYKAEARYAEAEKLYRRALGLRQAALGGAHADVAASMNNVAEILRLEGRYGEAAPLFERALGIFDRLGAPSRGDLGLVLNNLAEIYRVYRLYGEAERLLGEALPLIERAYGGEHVRTAMALNNLAQVLEQRGKLAESERLQLRALEILRRSSGRHDAELAVSLSNLGCVYTRKKRLAESIQLHKQALNLIGAAETPARAAVLHNLSGALEASGRLPEALAMLDESRSIRERLLGGAHPVVAYLLKDYARLLRRMKRTTEAIELEAKAQAALDQNRPPAFDRLVVPVAALKSWRESER